MTTLTQIFDLIETFGTDHAQIRKVLFGDISDVDNTSPSNGIVLRYFPDPSNFIQRVLQMQIIIEFMDQALDDESNVKDIMNDTIWAALDFIAYMNRIGQGVTEGQQVYEFTVDKDNIQLIPFNDRYESNYWGWQMLIRFNMPFDLDKCQIPFTT